MQVDQYDLIDVGKRLELLVGKDLMRSSDQTMCVDKSTPRGTPSPSASTASLSSSTPPSPTNLLLLKEGFDIKDDVTDTADDVARAEIHSLVCFYNESKEELRTMLGTYVKGNPIPAAVRLTLVLDGHARRESLIDENSTFASVCDLLQLDLKDVDACAVEFGCRVYSGVVPGGNNVPVTLFVKGPDLQCGKRVSMCHFLNKILPSMLARGAWSTPTAFYHHDGDSGLLNGLGDLYKIFQVLTADPNNGACMSDPRPLNTWTNALTAAQRLEYACNIYKGGSAYGTSWCCCGMSNMLRYDILHAEKDGLPSIAESFSRESQNLRDLILLDGGEDAEMAQLVRQRGYDIRCCTLVDTGTHVPEHIVEFIGQRRRWVTGTFIAMWQHLFGRNGYFSARNHRWLFGTFLLATFVSHCLVLAVLPATLANTVTVLVLRALGEPLRDETTVTQPSLLNGFGALVTFQDSTSPLAAPLLWTVYAALWLVLCAHAYITMDRSSKDASTWLRCLVYGWGALAFGTTTLALTTLAPTWVLCATFGSMAAMVMLNTNPAHWPGMLLALPLMVPHEQTVKVICTVYSLANVDSQKWGTRSTTEFFSKLSDPAMRAKLRKQKFVILVGALSASALLGAGSLYLPACYLYSPLRLIFVLTTVLKISVCSVPGVFELARQALIIRKPDVGMGSSGSSSGVAKQHAD